MSERARARAAVAAPVLFVLGLLGLGLGVGSYSQYVLAMSFVAMLIGAALVLLVGFARCITLASGSMMAVGGYAATLLVSGGHVPFLAAVLAAVLAGALAGLILAIPGVRFKSHNLAMITLVFQTVLMILIREARSITGGAEGIRVPPAELFGVTLTSDAAYLAMIGIGTALGIGLLAVVLRGAFGKNMRAAALNEVGAEAYGIDTRRYMMAAFVVSSAAIALAGALSAPYVRIIDPDSSYGVLASVFMLAYPIIGGMNTIWAGLAGGMAMRVLPEVLRPVADYQELIFASLVIVVTMFFPGGLAELGRRLGRLLRRAPSAATASASVSVSASAGALAPVAAGNVEALPMAFRRMAQRGPAATDAPPALKVQGVSRAFGALQAVDDVSFAVPAGGLHGIIGPNGAGKTSLFNIVSGFLQADTGRIELFGEAVLGQPARRRVRLGMTRTFQHVALFGELSCLDNAMIGLGRNGVLAALGHSFGELAGSRATAAAREQAQAALQAVGLADMARLPAKLLSLGNQRRLEIARAIVAQPRIILLDEPVSGLSSQEAGRLRDLLLDINARDGVAMLLIEHNIGFVTDLCRTVSVMGSGQVVAEGEARQVIALPEVRRLYFGERAAS
jgi:ABC-type branched-subunit amino acid transport system ATPase component/ABC-type branched-subunit amino acid transport system permease subunit